MAHHKHSDSAVSDELYFPGITLEVESTALISPSCLSPSHNRLARSSSAHSSKATYTRDNGSSVQTALFTSTTAEAVIVYKGVRVVVKQSPTGVSWRPSRLSLCGTEAAFVQKLQYSDILSARVVPGPRSCAACQSCLELSPDEPHKSSVPPGLASPPTLPPFVSPFLHQTTHWAFTPMHSDADSSQTATGVSDTQLPDSFHTPLSHTLVIFSYSQKRGSANELKLKSFQLSSDSLEALKELAAAINAQVHLLPDRPRNILVFINPFSGARAARKVWTKTVQPVLNNSLVKYTLVCTEYMDHAKEYISNMKREELEQYQGLVAIGGDGLFQELVRGLVCQKAGGALPKIRLGHIPAGSTDAVAYTLHGTRSVMTAALHIVLGSRMAVDLSKVTGADGSVRYSMCMAGYGFLGDVMEASEMLRWMGPVRYDVAGALRYLRLRSYSVEVSYKPAAPLRHSQEGEEPHTCYRGCPTCRAAAGISKRPTSPFVQEPTGWSEPSQQDDGWVTRTGEFTSIMCVTTPCRSDKSKSGVVPSAHLSDGRLVLVLVHACLHVQYLQFLIALAQQGVQPGMFPFVEVHRVSAVKFKGLNSKNKNSVWNVDGELLRDSDMQIQVQQGMIDVFSRGLERPL